MLVNRPRFNFRIFEPKCARNDIQFLSTYAWKMVINKPWFSFLFSCFCFKQENAESCRVTYEFDVVLLIQQEVLYLQIPVKDKEWWWGEIKKKKTPSIFARYWY